MSEFNQAKYVYEYQKEKTQRVALQFNKLHDADILEHLDKLPNKQGYIKALIRADIKKGEQHD